MVVVTIVVALLAVALRRSQTASTQLEGPQRVSALPIGPRMKAWDQVELLEDPSGSLTLGDVLAPPWSERFEVHPGNRTTPGEVRTAIWLRLRLSNPGPEPLVAAVASAAALLEDFTVFPDPQPVARPIVYGTPRFERSDWSPWRPAHHQATFPLAPGEERTIHVRLRSEFISPLAVRAGDLQALLSNHDSGNLGAGAYYGILAAMLFYNFALFLQVRRRMYLFYVLTLLLLHVGLQMVLTGTIQQAFSNQNGSLATRLALMIVVPLGMFFQLQFTRETLGTPERHPKMDRLLRRTAWIFLGLLLLAVPAAFGSFRAGINLLLLAVGVAAVLTVAASSAVARAGAQAEARYFLIAFPLLFAGLLVHLPMVFGLIVPSFVATHALRFAMVVESLLLSLALGERYRALSLEKVAIEQRERQNRKYREFTRVLSHDLANQTNVILNWAHFAAQNPLTPDGRSNPWQRIVHAARRQAEVLENVRKLQRLESGAEPLELVPVALPEVLDEVSRTFEDELEEKRLRIEIENLTPSARPVVLAEEVGLRDNVLCNLVSNAIKFSPPDSAIVIRVRHEPGATVVEVIDRGAGIPVELRGSLFSDEVLVSRPGTSGERGTGIGMAIASRAAERFGARLGFETWVEGERPEGPGTRFFVRLSEAQPQTPHSDRQERDAA